MPIAVTLLLLSVVYALVITGVVLLLGKLGVSNRRAVMLGLLVYGIAAGMLAAWAWPRDSSTLPNAYAVLLGDWITSRAIESIGDPQSSQAHDTIPWIARVSQPYVVVSGVLCGSMGFMIQWLFNRVQPQGALHAARLTK